jgi:Protein of unknown function (DUF2946)
MDDIVRAALKKWPQVPACRGWLGLDARGDWYMRDDRIQTQGAFPHPKGSRIQHEKLIDFIARNYEADEQGAWFFQNGPQRVYVELEAAPWVWRLQLDPADAKAVLIRSHTGHVARHRAAWLDERGRLFVETDLGLGIVHSMDMGEAAVAVESEAWCPQAMPFAQMPERFGYVLSPQAAG